MKLLPRGLIAAVGASVAFHLAAVAVPWRGGQPGAPAPGASTATLVARLIELAPATRVDAPPIPAAPPSDVVTPTAAVPAIVTEVATAPPASVSPPAPAPEVASKPVPTEAPALPDSLPALPADRSAGTRGAAESRTGLDRGPRPLDAIDPAFPAAAGTRGGTVILRLVISDTGEVESIVVVHAAPPGLFDEAALAAFGRARFAPGLRGGIPVRSEVMYEVEFAPLGKGTEASGRTY